MSPLPPAYPLALLTRIRLWLRLIWRGGGVVIASCPEAPFIPAVPNRARARLSRRSFPAARRRSDLDRIIHRHHGRAYYLRWIYDYGLSGRVRWCFMDWNWRWPSRRVFKGCGQIHNADGLCHAPLCPD